jgi:hypothetical protein
VAALVVECGGRLDRGCPVGGAEVFGRLSGGLGLLVVVMTLVPVVGGDDGQEEGVEEDREEGSVLGGGFTKDCLDGASGGVGLLVVGADAGASCPFERGGRPEELGA